MTYIKSVLACARCLTTLQKEKQTDSPLEMQAVLVFKSLRVFVLFCPVRVFGDIHLNMFSPGDMQPRQGFVSNTRR